MKFSNTRQKKCGIFMYAMHKPPPHKFHEGEFFHGGNIWDTLGGGCAMAAALLCESVAHLTCDRQTHRQTKRRFGSGGLIIGYKNNTETVSRHRKHQLQHNLLGPKKTIYSYRESAWSQKIVMAILPHSTSLFCSNPALLYTSTTNLAIANRSRNSYTQYIDGIYINSRDLEI